MSSHSPPTSPAANPAASAARSETPFRYTAQLAGEIEMRWQKTWETDQTFRAKNPGEKSFDAKQQKFYCLDMFPYPSGAGLHVGHPEGYTATDIISRYKRHKGFNVLHPMGWDAFGLPAEQYAIQTGVHPAVTTKQAIDTFRRQLKRFGFSYDWSREFATIDPGYYKWTQWIWLKAYNAWYDKAQDKARPIAELIHEFETGARDVRLNPDAAEYSGAGDLPDGTRLAPWNEIDHDIRRMVIDSYRLAYTARQTVNWCPKLGTALANEEVIDGKSERGGYPVFKKPLTQWMFRITSYADRLLADLDLCDWPESTRIMQSQWIGRSEGAEVDFPILAKVPRLSEPGAKKKTDGENGADTYTASVLKTLGSDIDLEYAVEICAPSFEPCNPFPKGEPAPDDLKRSQRYLPHLEMTGATYFVTWRVLPGEVLSEEERRIVLRALTHWEGVRCTVFAVVVMPDHVHWIVKPFEGYALNELIESVKRFSAREINSLRGRHGSIWDPERFDHIVRDIRWLSKFIWYVLRNPVRKNLVNKPSDYEWLFLNPEVSALDGALPVNVDASQTPGSESRGTFEPTGESLRVFTTRPDTIFGATYMVVAPEHPLIGQALAVPGPDTDVDALMNYFEQATAKTEVDRVADTKKKTGVFTGFHARNPATGESIPIWTSDYVLMTYGTGAIMAVPGQDTRDWDFAKTFDLPIVRTVQPPKDFDGDAYVGEGIAINSANDEVSLNGLNIADAKKRIIDWLEETKRGMRKVNYKLRDWLFSRQRYWGEPFPIVFDQRGEHYPVDEKHLPVKLPPLENYQPVESDDPQPMLAKATDWVNTTAGEAGVSSDLLPADTPVTRETNTMPNWAGSCWYYLRFADADNDKRFVSKDAEQYWMGTAQRAGSFPSRSTQEQSNASATGVDLYIGGAEHAVLHLLYARFWHKILFDLGEVSTPEPFRKLFHQGLITSFAYQDSTGRTVPVDEVSPREGKYYLISTGEEVQQITAKMSKTLKNVVNPDDVITEFGADTFRLYEMYMGPLDASKPWNPRDISGLFRFLQRAWRLVVDESTGEVKLAGSQSAEIEKALHRMIARVGEDIEQLAFNTAIAAMIEFTNTATAAGKEGAAGILTSDQAERFAIALSPFAPHMTEEMWAKLGHNNTIAYEPWPAVDPAMLRDESIELPVQILGKVRGRIIVPTDADAKTIEAMVASDASIKELIAGKTVRKVIAVPGKIVNIVTG